MSPTHQDLSNDTNFSQIKSRVPVPLRKAYRFELDTVVNGCVMLVQGAGSSRGLLDPLHPGLYKIYSQFSNKGRVVRVSLSRIFHDAFDF